MVQEELVGRTATEWASPIVFAPEKDCLLQFCVNYRKSEAITIRELRLHSKIDECVDILGYAYIFSA